MKSKICGMMTGVMLLSVFPTHYIKADEIKLEDFQLLTEVQVTTDSIYQLEDTTTKVSKENYVINSGFEEEELAWKIEGTINGIKKDSQNAKSGEWALNYVNDPFTLSQTIKNLPNGTYQFKVWVQGEAEKEIELFAEPLGGTRSSVVVTNTGWANWSNPVLTDIEVVNGECTIGVTSNGGGSWGWVDDISFALKPLDTLDKAELETLVNDALSKEEATYTAYSWNKFQEKLEAAQGVLNNLDATDKEVAYAYEELLEGIDQLTMRQVVNYEEIHVNPIKELEGRTDFINGVDVSSLYIVTQKGAEFYDVDGSMPYPEDPIKNALAILQNHGVNWIRLRIWNDPVGASQNLDYADKGPGGLNDLEVTKEIAQKAKELGLNFLLDFHYSDTWVHPGQQIMPEAWKGLGLEELKVELYDYTAHVLQELEEVNALPDMVQIGNENNDGMLHPIGRVNPNSADELEARPYIELVKSGIQAVRDNEKDNEKIKVMIHLAEAGNSKLFRNRFDLLEASNVDYDVIGASYYPYWHGSLSDASKNLEDLASRYNKEIIIAETSYAYTSESDNSIYSGGTKMDNIFWEGQEKDGKFKASIQGQATALRDIIEITAKIPNNKGMGTFYWEPAWITTPEIGAGWGAGETSVSWANQGLFNYRGQALPSLDTYNLITNGTYKEPKLIEVLDKELVIEISQGNDLKLPESVDGLYSDDAIKGVPVIWEAYDKELQNKVGNFNIKGQIKDSQEQVIAKVTVTPKNYLSNSGFEDGNTVWIKEGNVAGIQKDSGNAKNGSWAFNYGNDAFEAYQTLTDLPKGTYTFKAWVQGAYGKSVDFFVKDSQGNKKVVTATNNGWREWSTPTITDINVDGGQYTIGFSSNGGGDWGWIDDIEFIKEDSQAPEVVDKAQLKEIIALADKKLEKEYTLESWKVFSNKLASAKVILSKEDATNEEVEQACNELSKAIDALVKTTGNEDSTDSDNTGSSSSSGGGHKTPTNTTEKQEENIIKTFKKLTMPELPKRDVDSLKDIHNHWAQDAIKNIVSNGIMIGKTAQVFGGNDILKRKEMDIILGRLVLNSQEFIGIGEENTFNLKDNPSRLEVVIILSRLVQNNEAYEKVTNVDEILASYKDHDTIPVWAKEEVAWCISQGIIKGNEKQELNLNKNVTRAEMATMLDRIFE